jgi:DNA-binding Lrp family transcriptional regulator
MMKSTKSMGPHASVRKYDLLTAMAVAGLNGKSGFQTTILRLVAVITARYNWKLDELTVGQRDLAKMWSVDERTVKREVKRLLDAKILLQLRPGVRGRVAAFRLNQDEIYRLSLPHWDQVGPDFAARMEENKIIHPEAEEKVVRVDFRTKVPQDAAWERTFMRLAESDPHLHRSWFAALLFDGFSDDVLKLRAPSSFVAQYILTHHLGRIRDIAGTEFPALKRIEIRHSAS